MTTMQDSNVLMILLLIGVLIITGVMAQIFTQLNAETPKQQCRLSLATLNTAGKWFGFFNPFELVCPRESIILARDKDKVSSYARLLQNQESREVTYRYQKTTQTDTVYKTETLELPGTDDIIGHEEALKDAIAYEMEQCWELFYGGAYDILDGESPLFTANVCVICAEFIINRPIPTTNVEMDRHLYDTELVSSARRGDFSSMGDYLYRTGVESESLFCKEEAVGFTNDIQLREGGAYAVFFVRNAGSLKNIHENVYELITLKAEGNTGEIFSCNAVGVAELQDLPQYCNVILN